MDNIIKNASIDELKILSREGIEYSLLDVNDDDTAKIRIDGDELYYSMALDAICRR